MTESPPPSIVILAGPNGAGKSTTAPVLLHRTLGVTEFVNADDIARDMGMSNVQRAAMSAGRIMLGRIRELARQRRSFAFETTLASRSFAPWLAGLRASGYECHLQFLWLPSADFAIERVAERVRAGGHDVPAETVRRRYRAGLRNFFRLYEPLASTWTMYDGSAALPTVIAERVGIEPAKVYDESCWDAIMRAVAADAD